MYRWLNRIQIWCGGFLAISDDLITFWEELVKNKTADGGHTGKMTTQKACERDIDDVVVLQAFVNIYFYKITWKIYGNILWFVTWQSIALKYISYIVDSLDKFAWFFFQILFSIIIYNRVAKSSSISL